MDRHKPVLVKEVIENLNLSAGDNAIDCTVGDGGHSERILQETGPDGRLLALDADPESLQRSKEFLENFSERIIFVRENFKNLEQLVKKEDFEHIKAVLFDLGWSTDQLERGKGFSFDKDEPLDMRYDNEGRTAADIVNNFDKTKLEFIFRRLGEEDFSEQISASIVEKREEEQIQTTEDLRKLVLEVYRKQLNSDKEVPWVGGKHPATNVFQALRIAVNKELKTLRSALPQALEVLDSGGSMAVISFHSLEDRIVKHFFKDNKGNLKIITSSPITPTSEEIESNPSSRSAKLRVAQKL
ncbi:MAG: 16S rRNA (cytosine(1402)-N(4))-methyltransferase RsmH [Candidatus Magasanikbacteria bacterium]